MTEGSWRTTPLPPNWYRLRSACKRNADGQCQAPDRDGNRCTQPGNEAHHAGRADEHDNLQWLCAWHHRRITTMQAAAGKQGKWTDTRPAEKHPGLT